MHVVEEAIWVATNLLAQKLKGAHGRALERKVATFSGKQTKPV